MLTRPEGFTFVASPLGRALLSSALFKHTKYPNIRVQSQSKSNFVRSVSPFGLNWCADDLVFSNFIDFAARSVLSCFVSSLIEC